MLGRDVLLGVPALSEHLVLGAGASLRSARLFNVPPTVAAPTGSTDAGYEYRSVFECPQTECAVSSSRHWQYVGSFLEANVSAQYVF